MLISHENLLQYVKDLINAMQPEIQRMLNGQIFFKDDDIPEPSLAYGNEKLGLSIWAKVHELSKNDLNVWFPKYREKLLKLAGKNVEPFPEDILLDSENTQFLLSIIINTGKYPLEKDDNWRYASEDVFLCPLLYVPSNSTILIPVYKVLSMLSSRDGDLVGVLVDTPMKFIGPKDIELGYVSINSANKIFDEITKIIFPIWRKNNRFLK